MEKSALESYNISANFGVLGDSLTRIITLYVQNEYLAITFGIKIRAFNCSVMEGQLMKVKDGLFMGILYICSRELYRQMFAVKRINVNRFRLGVNVIDGVVK